MEMIPTHSLSKSEAKTLNCEYYYGEYQLRGIARPIPRFVDFGLQFHRYREHYVRHLMSSMLASDPDWATEWLKNAAISEEVREAALKDTDKFEIDPDKVYDVELFLAIDKDLNPIKGLEKPGPGMPPKSDLAYAHGTLDYLEIDGTHAQVDDYKTNWSETTLFPYEAEHYALLVFCNFPHIETVGFKWELVRLRHDKPTLFKRSDVPQLQRSLNAYVELRQKIAERAAAGKSLTPDPLAGLCTFCELQCPIRAAAARGEVPTAPLQTKEDVEAAAGMLIAIKGVRSQLEQQLRVFADANGSTDLKNGYQVALDTTYSRKHSLRDVLAVLGVDIPEESAKFEIVLNTLEIGAAKIKSLAKAKKRAGLSDMLDAVCETKPRTTLKVGKKGEEAEEE